METTTVISAVLTLVAGIGIFLVACQMMSSNLESASSKKLKALFSKAAKSKWLGVGIGTVGTAAIQSSGATTVMVIGFVNAGIMSLAQAATIIYGANIGTTVTAQIVALGMFGGANSISTTIIFSAFAGIGAFMSLFAKSEGVKRAGGILTGFGMLFVGLSMMSGSMADFAKLEGVKVFLANITSGVLLVLIGALLTAIIQSSSVMTSVAIAMVVSGLITLDQGIFLTLGSNIGSCVVALIAGMTSGKNAKRTSLVHLIFNVSGVVLFMAAGWLLKMTTGITFGSIFESMFPGAPQEQLAMFHTIFNVLTVLLIMPLTNLLVKAVCKMVPDSEETEDPDAPKLHFIDYNLLKTPPVAVEQTKREIINMGYIAMDNFHRCLDIITSQDFSGIAKFRAQEKQLNFLNKEIVKFVVKLSEQRQLSKDDHIYLSTTFHTVSDFERVGDYAENIIEYAESLKSSHEGFSPMAIEEIGQLRVLIDNVFERVIQAYTYVDIEALFEADKAEEKVDVFTDQMAQNHINRLSEKVCTPTVGAQYLSLSSNSERISDHLINVGKTIKDLIYR